MFVRCLPVVLAIAAPGALANAQDGAAASPPPAIDNSRFDRLQSEVEALRRKTDEQAKQIEDLKAQNGEAWLTEQRAGQIRGIVGDVLSDSSGRSSFRNDGATAGYDGNFFLASADGVKPIDYRDLERVPAGVYRHGDTSALRFF